MSKWSEKFINFSSAGAAITTLLKIAKSNHSLIEALVLYATGIDHLLRTCLLCKKQQSELHVDTGYEYLYQKRRTKKYFSEKDIYNQAFQQKIIGKTVLKELYVLYEYRNEIIHKFCLQPIVYVDIIKLLNRYQKIYFSIFEKTKRLEGELVRLGIMHTKEFEDSDGIDLQKLINSKLYKS